MVGPLEGTHVIELGTMVAVPAATHLLATQGASVTKVESLTPGDPLRFYGSKKNGMSGWFANVNAGKRSLAVDLAADAGSRVLSELIASADVLVQGFRPGVMTRLGFGPDEVLERHPGLVYVSSSGYGADGPYRDRPVFDPLIQAASGWAGVQTVDGAPSLVKGFVADKVAALTTAQAITAALIQRARTGAGQHIELSMLEANVAFNWPDVMMHTTLLDDDASHEQNVLRSYQLFPSSDGWVSVTAGTDTQWHAVCEALDRPELAHDPRFATAAQRSADFDGWYAVFGDMCRAFPSEEILARCHAADVPATAVLEPDQVATHEQLRARDAIVTVTHPVVGTMLMPRQGPRFGDGATDPQAIAPAPTLGQHSGEILAELGYDDAAIADLRDAGVIG